MTQSMSNKKKTIKEEKQILFRLFLILERSQRKIRRYSTRITLILIMKINDMTCVCCSELLSNGSIDSSNADNHRRSKFIFEQELTSYVKRFGRHWNFSSYEKDFDEEFDEISLSDNQDVSFSSIEMIRLIVKNIYLI